MAKLVEGDSRGFHKGPNGITSRLPPRIPSIPGRALLPSDLGAGLYSNQNFESLNEGQRQHKRTPSCNMVMQEQPVWLDELLEDSESSSKKTSHRRSASDSFTFLDNTGGLSRFNIAEEEEPSHSSTFYSETSKNRNIISNNCLTDLLDDLRHLQDQRNAPISVVTQPAASRCEASRMNESRGSSTKAGSVLASSPKGLPGESVSLLEEKYLEAVDSSCNDNTTGDANADPKKTKRQSAQRSRVRKLQYIAELERIVNALQTQVSSLSPQVLLFQHQRALLNMDNIALKQKIALCARGKSIKDTQNETLGSELQRLKKLYELQLCQDSRGLKQQPHRIHGHSSLPKDFGLQLHQYEELTAHSGQSEMVMPSSDALPRVMKDVAGLSLDAQGDGRAQRGS